MFDKLSRAFNRIIDIMAFLAAALIIFSMISVSINVLMRYIIGKPLIWVTEVNGYLLLYATFLASAWIMRKDAHVKVDIVMNWLPPRAKVVVNIINSFICIVVMVVILIHGTIVSLDFWQRGVYNPTILMFPKAFLVVVIPIGCFFLAFVFMSKIVLARNELNFLMYGKKNCYEQSEFGKQSGG